MILQDAPASTPAPVFPKKERFVPFGNNIVGRIIKRGGPIALPEGYQESQPRVRVLSVGPGRVLDNGTVIPPKCKPTDVVLVGGPITPDGMMSAVVDLVVDGEKDLVMFDAKYLMGKFEEE